MTDCYYPPSFNYLAPAPDQSDLTAGQILARLTAAAREIYAGMRRGEIVWNDVVRACGMFIIHRRIVKVGLVFTVLNDALIEIPRADALLSVGRQMNAIYN